MTLRRDGSMSEGSPRRKRAAPTPPASTVIRCRRFTPRSPTIGCRPFNRYSSHAANERGNLRFGQILTRLAAGGLGDGLLHQRTAEIVATRQQSELRELGPQLHP